MKPKENTEDKKCKCDKNCPCKNNECNEKCEICKCANCKCKELLKFENDIYDISDMD